ncbi:MAG: Hsp33 family molecular chaperone HslO [Rhizomicrobium sp.]
MSLGTQVYSPAPAADFVLRFDLPLAGLRGRLVRLAAVATRALEAHALPEPAARVAAETCVLGALLGSALKLEGRLTVQTKSTGPLDLVASDYYGGEQGRPLGVRAFAHLDEGRFAALGDAQPSFGAMAGEGVMAITIDPTAGGQRYQGIASLVPQSIAASAEAYFSQSEQLPTALRLAAATIYAAGQEGRRWVAGGLMLQATPDDRVDSDDWERLAAFLATVEDMEIVDVSLTAETLLWRLFHEDEVRVHPAEEIAFRCDCDSARIARVLRSYSESEVKELVDSDGVIRARCEFCGRVHQIGSDALT